MCRCHWKKPGSTQEPNYTMFFRHWLLPLEKPEKHPLSISQ